MTLPRDTGNRGFVPDPIEPVEVKKENRTWTEKVNFVDGDFNLDQRLSDAIEKYITNPDKYLGEGGAGTVFELENGICVKMIKSRHDSDRRDSYDLGNHPRVEAEIQHFLSKLRVSGVFAPAVLSYYAGDESAAILMEQLDAVDLQQVLLRKKEMPEGFDIDSFFEKLEDFIDAMHKSGVVHKDLDPRNIMVDNKTGDPRIIDFGRSLRVNKMDGEDEYIKDLDYAKIEETRRRIQEFLTNNI